MFKPRLAARAVGLRSILLPTLGLAISITCLPVQAALWEGDVSAAWNAGANWAGGTPAGDLAGGTKNDQAVFGTRAAGAFDPTHTSNGNQVAGLLFQDEWTLYLSGDLTLRSNGRGIDVDISGKDGTVAINGGAGYDVLWYDNPTNTIAAGDTVVLNRGWEALTDGQDHTFNGGGTFVLNGSFATGAKEKDTQFIVNGNTTLVANSLMRLGDGNGADALNIAVGSTLAGAGGLQAGGAAGVRRATVAGTLSPGWGATTFATFGFDNVSQVDLTGILKIDIDAAGQADGLTANNLNLGSASTLDVAGLGGADAYVIATYSSLTGAFDLSRSVLPANYHVDYNYQGGNQIALVIPEPASVVLMGVAGLGALVRRRLA